MLDATLWLDTVAELSQLYANMSALYRLDAAVSREYYAQLKEAQGHFIGARKFRKGGQDRGEMACGNNK